jgi:hypothetical protein
MAEFAAAAGGPAGQGQGQTLDAARMQGEVQAPGQGGEAAQRFKAMVRQGAEVWAPGVLAGGFCAIDIRPRARQVGLGIAPVQGIQQPLQGLAQLRWVWACRRGGRLAPGLGDRIFAAMGVREGLDQVLAEASSLQGDVG